MFVILLSGDILYNLFPIILPLIILDGAGWTPEASFKNKVSVISTMVYCHVSHKHTQFYISCPKNNNFKLPSILKAPLLSIHSLSIHCLFVIHLSRFLRGNNSVLGGHRALPKVANERYCCISILKAPSSSFVRCSSGVRASRFF